MKPTLVVMAAGMGSRYGGLKQLDPMGPNGERLLDYSVFDAGRAGFGKVVFIIRRDFEEAFREEVLSRFGDRIETELVFQELDDLPEGFAVPPGREKPWGTAHAVRACRGVVREPFAVQNADDFYGPEAYRVLARALSELPASGGEACMVGYRLHNTLSPHGTVNRGVCRVGADGRLETIEEILDIGEHPEEPTLRGRRADGSEVTLSGEETCSMNFWGFTPAFLDVLEEEFPRFLREHGADPRAEWLLPPVIDERVREGRLAVRVLSSPDRWFGVTYPEDRPRVVKALAAMHEAGRYPARLWEE